VTTAINGHLALGIPDDGQVPQRAGQQQPDHRTVRGVRGADGYFSMSCRQ
jgi:hypothetical protein